MQAPLNRGKSNLSLVAYYGEKPPEIEILIREAQAILQDELGPMFSKYAIGQVHATLISLEGHRTGNAIVNTNYDRFCQKRRIIDFTKAFRLLENTDILPFTVRIGGYRERDAYPFTSRGAHPYQRSFSIQGDIAVAMGWPWDGSDYSPALDRLRRAFNAANILHKYHRTPDDIDNDFYFVLGNVTTGEIGTTVLQHTCLSMKEFLAHRDPLVVPVTKENLRVIAYVDPKVPPDTTRSYTVDEAAGNLEELSALYRDAET